MEILESYDLTRCAYSAGQLAGCDPKTVRGTSRCGGRWGDPLVKVAGPRPKLIDAVYVQSGGARRHVPWPYPRRQGCTYARRDGISG
jgi:hypothetical protein